MQRATVLVVLMAGASLVLASGAVVCPPSGQDNAWFRSPSPAMSVDDNAQSGTAAVANTDEIDYLKTSGRPGTGIIEEDDQMVRITPFMDWSNDTLIGETGTLPTLGVLTTDATEDGDIFVGVLDPCGTDEDTAYVWYSSNAGQSWNQIIRFGTGAGTNGGIDDYVLRVGWDANGSWVYHFLLYNKNTTDGGLWVFKHRVPYTSGDWTQITQQGDTLLNIAADLNMEDPQHIFVGYETQSTRVYMWSSKDSAETWGNQTYIMDDRHKPAICAGSDGYVYVACLKPSDSTHYRMGRHTNNLESGGSWKFVNVDSSADHQFRDLSIAADRAGSGATQTAICLATYKYPGNGNIGPRYGWTTNGGEDWSSSFWPVTNQSRETWDMRHPYIRRSYHSSLFRAVITVPEPTESWDTLVYAYAQSATPTEWTGRGVPNDHRITGEYAANVDYSVKNLGGYVAYREFAAEQIWFDGYAYTDVEQDTRAVGTPADARVGTFVGNEGAISFNLPNASNVRAVLYDGAGRVAGRVFDGRLDAGEHRLPIPSRNLAEGVYFLNLDINGKAHTAKLVQVH